MSRHMADTFEIELSRLVRKGAASNVLLELTLTSRR